MPNRKSVSIARPNGAKTLSPGQKKFNTLVQKIDIQRKLLQAWNEAIPLYRQRHDAEFGPLLASHRELMVELVRLLHQRVPDKGFSKADRQFMRELICSLAEQLMHGPDEEEMKALYNCHSDIDLETEEAQAREDLKALMEQELGVDLGDMADLDSPEKLMQRLQQEMEAQTAEQQRADEARAQQRAQRRPTAKQAKAQTEAVNTSQSIREVYRKLASALHPDRETDDAERQRKTVLMQRVNQAYANKDLLSLLQLQLEIEQIDQSAIDGIAEDRLRHFNKVLTEQLAELQAEVQEVESGFKNQFDLSPFERISPSTAMKALTRQKQELQYDIYQMQRQLKTLVDTPSIKRWLKAQRELARQDEWDELLGGLGRRF